MIGTHQSKAEPWMLRNAITDVDRLGLLTRFKSVEKSLTSISSAVDDPLPTFSPQDIKRIWPHKAVCPFTAFQCRSISLPCEFKTCREDFEASRLSVETCNIEMKLIRNVCESISNPTLQ